MALCGCKLWERHCSLIKDYLMSSTLQFRLRHVSYFCLIEQMQDQDDQTKPMRTRQFHVVGAHFDDYIFHCPTGLVAHGNVASKSLQMDEVAHKYNISTLLQ